jgi:hypothetical protein
VGSTQFLCLVRALRKAEERTEDKVHQLFLALDQRRDLWVPPDVQAARIR